MIKKREKMKQKIKFFLNNKKNKSLNINKDNNNNSNNNNKEEEEKDEENNSENEEKSDEENNEEEKEIKKEESSKKKNNENIDLHKGQNDYESFRKKKIFKDNFFELDE